VIPRELTPLVGRDRELTDIESLLRDRPLLTLKGPGGSGKTRLALRSARHAERWLEDGAVWVELASLTQPALVPRAVCTALGLEERAAAEPREALRTHLRDRRLLLVLDNCEHLIDACAELVSILIAAAPGLHILATSREPLHVPGETVWLVPSLSLPDPSATTGSTPLEVALASESVRLFAARASAVLPGFSITAENAAAVTRICGRLEGMPLAIELCAAHVGTLSGEQIAQRLEQGLPLPATGGRMGVSRHRTLEATLDWSHALLTDAERVLFRRLAVFAGPAAIGSVEAVCSGEEVTVAEVLDVLARLIDRSLVVMQETAGEARYRLLEPVRRYAVTKLGESGEAADVQARHTAHFLRQAEEASGWLCSGERAIWLDTVRREQENLRQAWEYARAAADAESMQRYAGAMFWYWHFAGSVGEGRQCAEAALAASERRTPERAAALYAAGSLAWIQGDFPAARRRLEESVRIARETGDATQLAGSLRELGNVRMFQGDPSAARRCYEESVELARRSGERWALALALTMLGDANEVQDGAAAARSAFQESEAIFRDLGDRWGVALTLFSLALIAGREGDPVGARRYAAESLALRRAEGDPWNIAEGLTLLGELAYREGRLEQAAESFGEALTVYDELGDRAGISLLLQHLAALHADRNEDRRAARLFGAAEALARTVQGRSPYTLIDEAERMATVEALRFRLGEDAFVRARAEGAAMRPGEATALALSAPEPEVTIALGPGAALRVFALGEPRVYLGDRLLRPADWGFAKPKELLFYLLCQPPRTKEQIGLDFWPEASSAQLRGRFRTTLHSLRRALGHQAWVTFDEGRYTFSRGLAYEFDTERFQSHLAESAAPEKTADEAIQHLEQAVALYRGDFLAGREVGEWAAPLRAGLKHAWIDALARLGGLCLAQGRCEAAARWYERALAADDLLETAHAELIRCYARIGQRGRALRHYEAVVALFDRELGSPPDAGVAALAERVRRGEPV
jgi:predicted ATPase/DNA-binding SARP family transcriptional activator